ncbi:MAG: hypothetical protein HFJ09_15810 [Lachnospiraceae bacterium]|nr:hypothetical protein [Lachnospiraceae bacterium]
MKAIKKVAVTTMALAMGVSTVTACGTKSVSMPQEPKDIAKLASERTAELKSYELKGNADIAMDMMGQKVDIDIDINAVYFKDPMKLKMDMKMVNNAAGKDASEDEKEMTASMYFMKEEDNYVMYMGMEDTWSKTTMSKDDEQYKELIGMLDKGMTSSDDSFIDLYTKAAEQPKDQTMLELKLTGEQIADQIKKSGADTSVLESAGASLDMIKQLGEIPISMGVDNDNVYWKSVSIDLKDIIQSVFDTTLEQYKSMLGDEKEISMSVDECQMKLTYDKYNKATDFELPEEAKNAQETDTSALTAK